MMVGVRSVRSVRQACSKTTVMSVMDKRLARRPGPELDRIVDTTLGKIGKWMIRNGAS